MTAIRKLQFFAFVAFVFALPLAVEAQAVPQLPHVFHGSATLNDAPLPAGTTVTARLESGTVVGSVVLEQAGVYGGSGAYDAKLVVQAPQGAIISPGTTLHFFTSGIEADITVPFASGDVTALDLAFQFEGGNVENGTLTTSAANLVLAPDVSGSGSVELPGGATKISLSNNSKLDVSSAVTTSGGKKSVRLRAGSGGDIELSNEDNASASVSIPSDTTISADEAWDGTIQPPKAGNTSGTPPSGFQVGNTAIDVGSPDVVLEFDKAVRLVLNGVTGAVAYKPSGSSSWEQITTQCVSATDNSNITAPDECFFQQGGDTIIWTYHFTTFAGLDEEGGGSGAGGGGSIAVADNNEDDDEITEETVTGDIDGNESVNILDFNLLMVNWGTSPQNSSADLNGDGEVDILDFNILIVNWTS